MVFRSVPAIQQQLHVLVPQDMQPLDGFMAVYKCIAYIYVSLGHCCLECAQVSYVPAIYIITYCTLSTFPKQDRT